MQGPEYAPGWRDRFSVGDVRVEVLGRHHTRNRPPRGHELVRQMSRGPLSLVPETTHEWAVLVEGRNAAVVRPTPSGRYSVGGRHERFQSVREAAEALGRRADDALRQARERRAEPEPEPPPGATP